MRGSCLLREGGWRAGVDARIIIARIIMDQAKRMGWSPPAKSWTAGKTQENVLEASVLEVHPRGVKRESNGRTQHSEKLMLGLVGGGMMAET